MIFQPLLKALTALSLIFSLTGCLQIEMIGPMVGSQVTIVPLRGGPPVVEGLVSSGVDEAKAEMGNATWNSLSPKAQVQSLGFVDVPEDNLDDETLYLVIASGGLDKDFNSDYVIGRNGPSPILPLHAIMTGAQLKAPIARVGILTEAVYQLVTQKNLEDMSDSEILAFMDASAAPLLGDINNDGVSNYSDVLIWSRVAGKDFYLGYESFFDRMHRGLFPGWSERTLREDSLNLVNWASWQTPYAETPIDEKLITCAFDSATGCTFETQPLIGMLTRTPVTADIMARTVVSHSWMAWRFEQLLNEMPNDILLLFRGVTAVVIGADIRPAHYISTTSAIYIDPNWMWQTPEEYATISQAPDYRSTFSSELNFSNRRRFVRDNAFAWDGFPDSGYRTQDATVKILSYLMLHELAHANDHLPPAIHSQLPWDSRPNELQVESVSDRLINSMPLTSSELMGIASVKWHGAPATELEKNYTGAEIGSFFATDSAAVLYAYTSQYEDTAELFAYTMMQILFGIEYDIGFTTIPPEGAEETFCEDYQVGWGIRNNVASPQVLPRVRQVIAELLPERDYSQALDNLPAPQLLNTYKDWCDSIVIEEDGRASHAQSKTRTPMTTKGTIPRLH